MPSRPSQPSPARPRADADLIRRCQAGESRAWDELVSCYSPLVYAIASRKNLPQDLQDDVFQDTFAAVIKHLPGLRDENALTKWIIITATREVVRTRKKMFLTKPNPQPLSEDVDDVIRLEQLQAVERSLRELGGPCEKLLRTMFADNAKLDYRTIARILGVPMGSVGPSRQRCLAKLAELMKGFE